jgi:hypothetical protein
MQNVELHLYNKCDGYLSLWNKRVYAAKENENMKQSILSFLVTQLSLILA